MLFSVCSEVRITPHHKNGLLHLHLDWYSILPSETAETLAAARVSGVASFSATLVGPSGAIRTLGPVNPNHVRYQLRYTRIFNFYHYTTAGRKIKDFSACGHLCGQSRFYTAFSNQGKSRKRRRRKALRRFASSCPGYRHGTPKAGALPTALHPVIEFLSGWSYSPKSSALPTSLYPDTSLV